MPFVRYFFCVFHLWLRSRTIRSGKFSTGCEAQRHGHSTRPGMHEAKVVTMGEWYPKDTSILTGEKSFVLFKYKNGGTLTLGPSSKVVVDETSQKSRPLSRYSQAK